MALGLLDLYLCLWEFYVMDSAQKIRLEDEHRSLLDSNDWLLRQNEQLVHTCNCQTLLLWDRQQAIHDMHQGLTALVQGIKWSLNQPLTSRWNIRDHSCSFSRSSVIDIKNFYTAIWISNSRILQVLWSMLLSPRILLFNSHRLFWNRGNPNHSCLIINFLPFSNNISTFERDPHVHHFV